MAWHLVSKRGGGGVFNFFGCVFIRLYGCIAHSIAAGTSSSAGQVARVGYAAAGTLESLQGAVDASLSVTPVSNYATVRAAAITTAGSLQSALAGAYTLKTQGSSTGLFSKVTAHPAGL
jgi:hypothetical protein